MDEQTGCTDTSHAQHLFDTSVTSPFYHWSSALLQSPSNEIPSISSVVPSTVFAVMPHCNLADDVSTELPSFSDVTSDPPPPEPSSPLTASSQGQDQTTPTSPPPCSGNVLEFQQRKPSDEGPLEQGSISLMLPKDSCDQQPGMVII